METRKFIIGIAIIILATAAGYYFISQRSTNTTHDDVMTFDDCVAAGNPVMESYPRQCNHEGKTYVEEISDEMTDMIQVSSPAPQESVTSPLTVRGEARGTWFFEADFPVFLYDANENLIATGVAVVEGEWMTEEFVPFSVTVTFDEPETATGILVLEKSNPSDMAEHSASVMIPVVFE